MASSDSAQLQGTSRQPDPARTDASLPDLIQRCHSIFSFTVHRSLIATVKRFGRDPAIVWAGLQNQFESQAKNRKLELLSELHSLSMSDSSTFDTFLKALDHIIVQLADVDEVVSNQTLVHVILKGLPKSWWPFKTTWSTMISQDATLTYNKLACQLQVEECNIRDDEPTKNAMVATT
jgi:hypothetical protein